MGRREDRLRILKDELLRSNPKLRIHLVPMSVSDMATVKALPSALPAEFADVSVLVNNAGLALGVTSVDKNSVEDAEQVMTTNVMGVIAMCSAFLPGMISRGEGHLINMGSVAGHYAYQTGSGDLTPLH